MVRRAYEGGRRRGGAARHVRREARFGFRAAKDGGSRLLVGAFYEVFRSWRQFGLVQQHGRRPVIVNRGKHAAVAVDTPSILQAQATRRFAGATERTGEAEIAFGRTRASICAGGAALANAGGCIRCRAIRATTIFEVNVGLLACTSCLIFPDLHDKVQSSTGSALRKPARDRLVILPVVINESAGRQCLLPPTVRRALRARHKHLWLDVPFINVSQ